MNIESATIVIPLSVANIEIDENATVEQKREAIYSAIIRIYPELDYLIRKSGIIHDSTDESIVE